MPMYSSEIIEEVRSRTDIADVISRYVNLKKNGNSYVGLCPFHNEKTPSFHVTPSKQMYYCFGCGAGGDVFNFLTNYENLSFYEALSRLASECGVTLPEKPMDESERQRRTHREAVFAANKDAAMYYYSMLRSPGGASGMEYFRGRGLSDETMKNFGLGYAAMGGLYAYLRKKGYSDDVIKDSGLVVYSEAKGARDKFWNRVMFPIMDASSKVIAFGGRVMGDGEPKYLNSPETPIFHKSNTIYALNFARKSRREGFILCEGYMDVISLHQAGFDNALASLGTAFTQQHASILARYTKDIYLSYDSDGAGTKAAIRALPIFRSVGIMPKVVRLEPYKDPDELIKAEGTEEYEKRLASAQNGFLFSIEVLARGCDMSDPGQKTQFQNSIAERLAEFSDEMERNNYLEAVCREYSIKADAMAKAVARVAAQESLRIGAKKGADPAEPESENAGAVTKKMDEGIVRSQMFLLKWMSEDPALFSKVRKYIDVSDFDEGIVRNTAAIIYEALIAGSKPQIQNLLSDYTEDEDQRTLARLFFEDVDGMEDAAKRSKAIGETVLRVKKHSMGSAAAKEGKSAFAMQIEGRKILSEIEKTTF